jgi:hypothetical protein
MRAMAKRKGGPASSESPAPPQKRAKQTGRKSTGRPPGIRDVDIDRGEGTSRGTYLLW